VRLAPIFTGGDLIICGKKKRGKSIALSSEDQERETGTKRKRGGAFCFFSLRMFFFGTEPNEEERRRMVDPPLLLVKDPALRQRENTRGKYGRQAPARLSYFSRALL